jgi:glycosyltransferase involved in cell wall biosynthesis
MNGAPEFSKKRFGGDVRVLLVHDGDGPLRGSERVVLDLIEGSPAVEWRAATNHAEFAKACEKAGVPATLIPFRRLFVGGTKWRDVRATFRAFKTFRRLLRDFRPDVIHINNGGACQWVMPAAWLAGVPALVHLHAPWAGPMRLLLGLHLPDRIVGVSNATVERFRKDPVAARKTNVVYNATPMVPPASAQERAALRAAMDIPRDAFVVATAGILIPSKKAQDVVAAIGLLPEGLRNRTILLVAGEGYNRPTLEQAAAGLPVRFLGHRGDIGEILRCVCDVLIVPSVIEAFSLVLLEAAACGVARIASAFGGNVESVIDGQDGLLFPAGDVEACARAITTLAEDADLRARLGEQARQRAQTYFSPAVFSGHFLEIYRQMRDQRRSRLARFSDAFTSMLNLVTGLKLGAR